MILILTPITCNLQPLNILIEPALEYDRSSGAVDNGLVLLLFLFTQIRCEFLRLHAGVRFVLRMDFHSRKTQRQILDKSLHHHILAILAAIRVVRHPDDKFVNLIDAHKLVQAFEQVRRLLVNRLARKRHFEFGIAKSDPDAMFSVIQSKIIHVTKYRIRTLNIAFFRSFFYLCAEN